MSGTYSANDNQNFFVQNGRTTSRVLNRPGGQQSFTLGGWSEAELQRIKQSKEQEKKVEEEPVSAENTENRAPAVVEKVQEPVQKEPEVVKPSVAPTTNQAAPPNNVPMSNNKFASGSNPNAGNVITGRPSSRVLAPPGGPSSGPLW